MGCERTTAMTDFTSEMFILLETVRAFSWQQPLPVLINSLCESLVSLPSQRTIFSQRYASAVVIVHAASG